MIDNYNGPVGHLFYSSPESFCGLAAHRSIAFYSDYYALGCMLFELFSNSCFFQEITKTGDFNNVCAALSHSLVKASSLDNKLKIWQKEIKKFKNAIVIPKLNDYDNSAPISIINFIYDIINKLSSFDFNDRVLKLEEVRRNISTCIKILENHKYEQKIIKQKKERRRKRSLKAAKKEKRINDYSLKKFMEMSTK